MLAFWAFSLSEVGLRAAEPFLAAELRQAVVWPSGMVGQGQSQVLAPVDARADSDVESYVQGFLDVSNLAPGTYAMPVQVTDRLGNVSVSFVVDVVIYDEAWNADLAVIKDEDNNGMADAWERQFLGAVGADPLGDIDNDGLTNLQEFMLGTDPKADQSPANRLRRAEIFVDVDPGVGLATPLAVVDGLAETEVEDWVLANFKTDHLEPGGHVFGLRMQRESGQWSEVRWLDVIVFEDTVPEPPPTFAVVRAEGFTQRIPSPLAGTPLALAASSSSWDARDLDAGVTLPTAAEEPGTYSYFVRFFDRQGAFAESLPLTMVVQDPVTPTPTVPFSAETILGVADQGLWQTVLNGSTLGLNAPPWLDWTLMDGSSSGRYSLLGWIGTGGVPANGTGTSVTFSPGAGGSLTWLWGVSYANVTQVNDKGMGKGQGRLPRFRQVTSEVPAYVYDTPNSRYRCVGYTGSGSVPASGVRNQVSFFLDQDSSVTWLWQRQYRVSLSLSQGEADGWQEWYDEGAVTALQPRADEGYAFDGWGGDLSGSVVPGALQVTAPRAITASFKPLKTLQLTVYQIDGSRSVSSHASGQILDLAPTVLTTGSGDTRDIPTGYQVIGSDFATGNGPRVSVAMTRDTVVKWLPTRQYRILPIVSPPGSGTVRVQGRQSAADLDWYDAGPVRLVATPQAGNRFVEWYLQKDGNSELDLMLTGELPLVARFMPVRPLGDYVTTDGGSLSSPNAAVGLFRSFLPTAKFKRTEITTTEYCAFLNRMMADGGIEKPNFISVRGSHPLAEWITGLKGEWFLGQDWTKEPDFRNVVTGLSVDYGSGGPSTAPLGTPPCPFTETDNFSFRLRGQIHSTRQGTVSFKEFCDDQVKLVFNGTVVLDNTSPTTNAAVQVQANQGWNDFEVVFVELTGSARFKLQWDPAGGTAWQDIPSSVLRSKALPSTWAARVQSLGLSDFSTDKELVKLNDPNSNIAFVAGQYLPVAGKENHPLVHVTWFGAMAYCKWLAESTGEPVSLPDEWSWEYAASGGNSTVANKYYPWGPLFLGASTARANYAPSGSGTGTMAVGSFPLYQGLNDMAGNVFEWTTTLYEQGNPVDPFRVLRGGSWNQPVLFLANSNRQVYKNQYYSDQATGFRPAVIYAPTFSQPGYVLVPAAPAVASPNASRQDYAAPAEPYLLRSTEVTNAEFAGFLNWALANGRAQILSNQIQGLGADWGNGLPWMELSSASPLENLAGTFVPRQGRDVEPAAMMTYHGAAAYCLYLGQINPKIRAILPTQWQWETAMLKGNASSQGPELTTNTGFWPGYYAVTSGVQEWTSSQPSLDLSDRRVVRGAPSGFASDFRSLTRADQHALMNVGRANLGLRPAIVSMSPVVDYAPEKVVLKTGAAARTVVLSASSFRTAPAWSWVTQSAPAWVVVTDLGQGRCQVAMTPPATAQQGTLELVVSDGAMSSPVKIPYSVVADSSYVITGLPPTLAVTQGEQDRVFYLRASPVGSSGSVVQWRLLGVNAANATLQSIGNLEAKLTIASAVLQTATMTIEASDGTVSGSASCECVWTSRNLQFVNLPSSLVFEGNRQRLQVPLSITGGSPGIKPVWSLPNGQTSWTRLLSQNGHSALLEIDRAGFESQASLSVVVSDTLATITGVIGIGEPADRPRFLLSQSHYAAVVGAPATRFLLLAEDNNLSQNLAWSLSSAPPWVSLTQMGGRSAELVINASELRPVTPITLQVSDGQLSQTTTITAEVSNTNPRVVGPAGPFHWDLGDQPQVLDYSVVDVDSWQAASINIPNPPSWLRYWITGSRSLRISINASAPVEGSFTVSASDGSSQVQRVVSVSIADRNHEPGIGGLPDKIEVPRYSKTIELPLTLLDQDAGDALKLRMVYPVENVQLRITGGRTALLRINPIDSQDVIPISLEISDGRKTSQAHLSLVLYEGSPDPHLLVAAEYFVDVVPPEGQGEPIPAQDNEFFADSASFARTVVTGSGLDVGWHRIGYRFKTVAGQWSSPVWNSFYVYDDTSRTSYASIRPDGSVVYSRWNDFVGPGLTASVPQESQSFVDQDADAGVLHQGGQVFVNNSGVEDAFSSLAWAEYFIDNDPGQGGGILLPVDRGAISRTVEDLIYTLDTSSLSPGNHRIGLRVRQQTGGWSEVLLQDFIVYVDEEKTLPAKKEIDSVEYVWNAVGSEGFGYGLNLDTNFLFSEIGVINDQPAGTTPLDTGEQRIGLRFRDNDGGWGELMTRGIMVNPPDSPLSLRNLHVESNIGIPFLNYDSAQLLGDLITIHVPQIYTKDSIAYACFGYVGQGSVPAFSDSNEVTFVMNQNSAMTWLWGRDCNVTSTSDYGTVVGNGNFVWYPEFLTGFGTFAPLELVTLSVPEFVEVSLGVRQYCQGWEGTGSAPTRGTRPLVLFDPVVQNSSVTWVWKKHFEFDIQVTGEGQVFGNPGWVPESQQVTLRAVPNPGFRFVRWEGDLSGNNAQTTLTADSRKVARAVFSRYKLWDVQPGILERQLIGTYAAGESVTHTVSRHRHLAVGTREIITGWRGVGSAPASGGTNSVNFVINADSEIRWNGVRQHWVDSRVNGQALGSIAIQGGQTGGADGSWYDAGWIRLTAAPTTNAAFVRWLGAMHQAPSTVDVDLNAPLDLLAVFRRSNLAPIDLVSVPSLAIGDSPNANIKGFRPQMEPFAMSRFETTTGQYIEALNAALQEGSIYVNSSKVYGKPELASFEKGMLVTWTLADSSKMESIQTVGTVNVTNTVGGHQSLSLSGQMYVSSEMAGRSMEFRGGSNADVTVGPVSLIGQTLPLTFNAPLTQGWHEFRVTVRGLANGASLQMIGPAGLDLDLAGFRFFPDTRQQGPIVLRKLQLGAGHNEQVAAPLARVLGGQIVLPAAAPDFWVLEEAGDIQVEATVSKPASASCGFLIRKSLRNDSPQVQCMVNSSGKLELNWKLTETGVDTVRISPLSARLDWRLRMTVRGGGCLLEVMDNGEWVDAVSGTIEPSLLPTFEGSDEPLLVGFLATEDSTFSSVRVRRIRPDYSFDGMLLAELSHPGCSFEFNGSVFVARAGFETKPANAVTYFGASAMAQWLEERLQDADYSLPDEWQYEAVSGGSTGDGYPWPLGGNPQLYANLSTNSTTSVGQFRAVNGLFDLAGNAWEWTSSLQWLGKGFWNNIRGGSHRQGLAQARSDYRLFYGRQDWLSSEVGFRLSKVSVGKTNTVRQITGNSLDSATSSSGLIRAAWSPVESFGLELSAVTNDEFAVFLNDLEVSSALTLSGNNVMGTAGGYSGRKLISLNEQSAILRQSGRFVVMQGAGVRSAVGMSYWGAQAYAEWKTARNSAWAFRLPTEWEWETLLTSGLLASKDSTLSKEGWSAALTGTSAINRWQFSGINQGVGNWTSSSPSGRNDYRMAKGLPLREFTGLSELVQRTFIAGVSESRSDLGMRLLVQPKQTSLTENSSAGVWMFLGRSQFVANESVSLTLVRKGDPVFARTLALTTDTPGLLLPASVTFPEGVSQVRTHISAQSLSILDDQNFRVWASESGEAVVEVAGRVTTTNSASLGISLDSITLKRGRSFHLVLSRFGRMTQSVEVSLAGSGVGLLGLNASQTIPAGVSTLTLTGTVPQGAPLSSFGIDASANWLPSASASFTVAKDDSANLSSLVLGQASILPSFAPDVLDYVLAVTQNTSSITLTATSASAAAIITASINGSAPFPIFSATPTEPLPLALGLNEIVVACLSEDGQASRVYRVAVTRLGSPVLAASTVSLIGANTARFSAEITSDHGDPIMERGFVHALTSVNSLPSVGGLGSSKTVVAGGTGAMLLNVTSLNVDSQYTLRAYARNSQGVSYSEVVNFRTLSTNARLAALSIAIGTLEPLFDPQILVYALNVAEEVSAISPNGIVEHSGASLEWRLGNNSFASIASGQFIDSIPLSYGANRIEFKVTAQDAVTVRTYLITITRARIAQSISFAAIADKLTTDKVNLAATGGGSGNAVTFAVTSGPGVITNNVLTFTTSGSVTVKASQAGNENYLAAEDVSHTFNVLSSNADLSVLTLSEGFLSPAFDQAITSYATNISGATASITITPTLAQANAITEVRINSGIYAAVNSGSPSGALSLNLGSNTIDVRVTAQDRVIQKIYTVQVTVSPPTNSGSIVSWRQQYFGSDQNSGSAADHATPDGDGIPNLLKYALLMTPGQNGSSRLPQAAITRPSGNPRLSITFQRDPSRSDVSIIVEAQSGLSSAWSEIARSVNGANFTGSAVISETSGANGAKNITVQDIETNAPHRFMRVRVVR